jgi:large subunit ribosomal protein L24
MKIKKNDNVIVIAGKDKGSKGKVLKAFPKLDKVVVEGVNIAKKHVSYRYDKKGEIIEREMPVHASNVKKVEKTATKKAEKTETSTKTKK